MFLTGSQSVRCGPFPVAELHPYITDEYCPTVTWNQSLGACSLLLANCLPASSPLISFPRCYRVTMGFCNSLIYIHTAFHQSLLPLSQFPICIIPLSSNIPRGWRCWGLGIVASGLYPYPYSYILSGYGIPFPWLIMRTMELVPCKCSI